jgi:methylase of polypeptide subunit release factors
MSGTHYIASTDSALVRKVLRAHSGGSALEIGAGNGGNLADLTGRFDLAVGTDIARPGMSDWTEGGGDFVLADCASCMRDSTFDLVAFNPPYVRGEIVDRTVDAGLDFEVPKRFILDALRVVKPTGKVIFLLNEEADLGEFERLCAIKGFAIRRVASERGFFEELSVYQAEMQ